MTFFLVGPFYPLRGGIAQHTGVLGQKLQERGHRVKVLAFRKQFPNFLFPGQTQLDSSFDHIVLDSEPVFVAWNPLSWLRTFLQARRANPDALIFVFFMPFFAPGFAAVCTLTKWFTSIRTIFILHNVVPHEKHPGDRFFTRHAFRGVDAFIAQSEVVKTDLFRWFPEAKNRSVALVSHPIYDCYTDTMLTQKECRGKLNLDSGGKLLLFFGLVRHYKGLDVLLRAMPQICADYPGKIQLLIAGEFYEPEEHYQRLVKDLDIGKRVTIINRYIANEEVSLYFRAADLLVLPYRSATQSGVVQVAYHFNLPVISTRVGGLAEVIEDGITGFLVEPEQPELIALAVLKYFSGSLGTALRANIAQHKEKYSWGSLLDTLEDFARQPESVKC